MTNKELLCKLRADAFSSLYWMMKGFNYYSHEVYRYAPMITDELFSSIADADEKIGVLEMERRLGRNLKVEELSVCRLSVRHLIFGNLEITESEKEREVLKAFSKLIEEGINRYETRTLNNLIKKITGD